MRNTKLTISYDGTSYHGFQTQPNGNTIQDHLERAVYEAVQERVQMTGSGRTDAGVHAKAQVANFHSASPIPSEKWKHILNSRLPDDIVVTESVEVPQDFHSRKDALRKTYCYFINLEPLPNVFTRKYELHHPKLLDAEAMHKAGQCLVGTHDFTSFCSIHSVQLSHVRTIYDLSVTEERSADGCNRLKISVTGSGFLYNMVRIITGTLLQIGAGKKEWTEMAAILESKNREMAGPTAPGHGLFLWEVAYA